MTCVITIRRRPLFPVYYIEPCGQRYLDCTKVTIKSTIFGNLPLLSSELFLVPSIAIRMSVVCCIFWWWLFVTLSLFCPVFVFFRKFILFGSRLVDIYHVKHILKKITWYMFELNYWCSYRKGLKRISKTLYMLYCKWLDVYRYILRISRFRRNKTMRTLHWFFIYIHYIVIKLCQLYWWRHLQYCFTRLFFVCPFVEYVICYIYNYIGRGTSVCVFINKRA